MRLYCSLVGAFQTNGNQQALDALAHSLRANRLSADDFERELERLTPRERLALFEYLDALQAKAAKPPYNSRHQN